MIHDFLYWTQKRSRRESDDIFLEAMGVLKVSPFQKLPLYWAVRSFGWWVWAVNDRKRHRGIKRVAGTMPKKSVELT